MKTYRLKVSQSIRKIHHLNANVQCNLRKMFHFVYNSLTIYMQRVNVTVRSVRCFRYSGKKNA